MKKKQELRISIYRKYYFANHLTGVLIFTEIVALITCSISIYYYSSNTTNVLDMYLLHIAGGFIIGLLSSVIHAASLDIKGRVNALLDEIDRKKVKISKIKTSINISDNYSEEDLRKIKKILLLEEEILKLSLEYDMISE